MTVREAITQILDELPDDRLDQLLDFARYLSWREERVGWQQFGQQQLARAYGQDEPDYTEADLRRGPKL